jgi:hypothetical protein
MSYNERELGMINLVTMPIINLLLINAGIKFDYFYFNIILSIRQN